MKKATLSYEFDWVPEAGKGAEVADGIQWLRMPLPFVLGHINLWLLKDNDGWAIVDTGVGADDCRDVWQQTFTGLMQGIPASRVIVTIHRSWTSYPA